MMRRGGVRRDGEMCHVRAERVTADSDRAADRRRTQHTAQLLAAEKIYCQSRTNDFLKFSCLFRPNL